MPLVHVLRENYPDDYRNYLRMDSATFDRLLATIEDTTNKHLPHYCLQCFIYFLKFEAYQEVTYLLAPALLNCLILQFH